MRRSRIRSVAAAVVLAVGAMARLHAAQSPAPAATILYDGRVVTLDQIGTDPANDPDALWVQKADLPRINEFELKPQGACRADLCIPVPKEMTRGAYFNLTAFARQVGEAVVVDRASRVWSFGEIPVLRGTFLDSRVAPDFTVPDRSGHPVALSGFRGRKVLVLTWASW